MATAVQLGAPGVYAAPDEPLRALVGQRMDVCAFAGLAPRGPVREPGPDGAVRRTVPVAVDSWTEYERRFGGAAAPRRLGQAVSAFFAQGGRRAYVLRIVHDYEDPADDAGGTASGRLPGILTTTGDAVRLRARNEGAWGNGLRAVLTAAAEPVTPLATEHDEITCHPATAPAVGALLRLTDAAGHRHLVAVKEHRRLPLPDRPLTVTRALFDQPQGAPPAQVEVVDFTLAVEDGTGRGERHERLGIDPAHPRWLAAVLADESELLAAPAEWADRPLRPVKASLPPLETRPFRYGADRDDDVTPADFFDARWVRGDERPGSGVRALAEIEEVALLCAPDLYHPGSLEPVPADDAPSPGSPEFELCAHGAPPAPPRRRTPELPHLLVDPELEPGFVDVVARQAQLVEVAEDQGLVALLDVPPRLTPRRLRRWRDAFDSPFAAAYHPWLRMPRAASAGNAIERLNPSAVAAGIIAAREARFGVPFGPANELAVGVVDVEEVVSEARHAELHPLGINVFVRERDGIRLTAARTLSRDRRWRQLSVRRLVSMLRRVLERQTLWMVFEPNSETLRRHVKLLLESYLRQLFRAGAFAGATDAEAFFVRCDETLNPQASVDAGRLVVEVGVAPAEPLEFVVVRLTRIPAGDVVAEDARG